MKRKIVVICLIVAALAIASLGSIAYFTAEDSATNAITTGGIQIELVERAEEGGELKPFENVVGVMPGTDVSKIVSVKNTDASPAYIRVKLDKTIVYASGEADASLVTYDINTADWTERDGYYYYNKVLAAGEETTPLFTTVSFLKNMGNDYQNSTVKIDVTAYATQVANNGATALEAGGWPA